MVENECLIKVSLAEMQWIRFYGALLLPKCNGTFAKLNLAHSPFVSVVAMGYYLSICKKPNECQ